MKTKIEIMEMRSNHHHQHHPEADERHDHREHHEKDHQNHHHHHGGHDKPKESGHHGHHEHMIKDFKQRFWISLIITIPIVVLAPMIQELFNYEFRFTGDRYVQLALASVV